LWSKVGAVVNAQRCSRQAGRCAQGVPDVLLGKFVVVVTTVDEFAAQHSEVVAMPAQGCLGQNLVQQLQQERREYLDDL